MTAATELARAYVETINSPANGWGQHVHPVYGISHAIMFRLSRMVGNDELERLIHEAFKENRKAKKGAKP